MCRRFGESSVFIAEMSLVSLIERTIDWIWTNVSVGGVTCLNSCLYPATISSMVSFGAASAVNPSHDNIFFFICANPCTCVC